MRSASAFDNDGKRHGLTRQDVIHREKIRFVRAGGLPQPSSTSAKVGPVHKPPRMPIAPTLEPSRCSSARRRAHQVSMSKGRTDRSPSIMNASMIRSSNLTAAVSRGTQFLRCRLQLLMAGARPSMRSQLTPPPQTEHHDGGLRVTGRI